jgi:hypothetical protein
MSDIMSKVIARVVHLRKLAAGNTNIHEANAAAAAADKLIQEHRLSQAELEASGNAPSDPMHSVKLHEGGRRTAWRETLLWALSGHYGCSWFMNHGRSFSSGREKRSLDYTLVGRQSDVEIVVYMFSWLTEEIERLCRWHSGGKGTGYARAWLDGAAIGVRDTFRARAAEMKAKEVSTAMVLLDNRSKEAETYKYAKNPGLKKVAAVAGGRDYSAREQGYKVGREIQIKEGLPGKTNGQLT